MDADTLRLILFIAGIALILGIYFFGRHRRGVSRIHATRRQPEEVSDTHLDTFEGEHEADDGYASTLLDEDESVEKIEPVFTSDLDILAERPEEMRSQHESERSVKSSPAQKEKPQQTAFSFSADAGDVEEYEGLSADEADAPVKIIQLILVARGETGFPGQRIRQVCAELEMTYGEMQIYHRLADPRAKQPRAIFSMASMVEPGTFPTEDDNDFTTPGVVFFAQLPGPRDGLIIFSDMLFTAERMAALLGGELQDESHSALSRQTIEHIREEILEHRRHLQLARSQASRNRR